MKNKKYNLSELKKIRETWPQIPLEAIPEKYRETFRLRKKAVDMYIDGFSVKEIEKETQIKAPNLLKFVERCILTPSSGMATGYETLFPGKRIVGYQKKEESFTQSGQFSLLLKKYPEIKDFLLGNYYGDKKYTLEKNMNFKTLHEKFIQKCISLGIQDSEYPLNTINKGYNSLIKFLKEANSHDIERSSIRESKDNRQKLLSTGIGERYTTTPLVPYLCTQVDGHIIDLEYIVEVEHDDGTISTVIATRPWIFAVIDVATRCILGFSVSQSFNYDQTVVLSAIRNAIEPRKRMEFTIPGLAYPENGGYPNLAYPELEYALPNTIMLDNAKAHLAGNVITKLVDVIGCDLNFGSVATPESRGIIERFFGTLEMRGFHRLPATTGSNTKDLKRRNPEKAAVKYQITFDQIVELLEVLIAEYNNSPHSSLMNETPLQCMERKIKHTFLHPAIASENIKKEVRHLTSLTKTVTVRGGNKNGKRPYFQYENATYRNDILASSGYYIGKQLTIIIDPEDVSTVEAYAEDGTPLGTMIATGEYGRYSHSLRSRKNAAKLARENGLKNEKFTTPISDYEEHMRQQAQTSRREATKADILRQELGKDTPSMRKAEYEKEQESRIKMMPVPEAKENHTSSDIMQEDLDCMDPIEYYNRVLKKKG